MTLLNFHGSSVPFLPDSTEFFQSGQLFLSGSNEQRLGAATSYQRSDPINTGGCKKPTAPDFQLAKFSTNVSAFKSGLQDCSSTSAWCSPQPQSMCLLLLAPIPRSVSSPSCCLELCCILVAVKSVVVVHKLREGLRDALPSNICCWRWMGRPRTEVIDALCSAEGEFEALSSTDCRGYATGGSTEPWKAAGISARDAPSQTTSVSQRLTLAAFPDTKAQRFPSQSSSHFTSSPLLSPGCAGPEG